MEIYIHKETGKGWILLEELEDDTGVFVSPAPRKMQRPFDEFMDEEETNKDTLIKKGIITKKQERFYRIYLLNRMDELNEEIVDIFRDIIEEDGKNAAIKAIDDMFSKDSAKRMKETLFDSET